MEHIGLDMHLQASVMAGLIDKFRGASHYINDPTNPMQITKTLIYRMKERKEHLDLNKLDMSHLLKESEATHIVVGVTYGTEVYCVLSLDAASDDEEAKNFLSKVASKMENALEDGHDLIEFQNQVTDEDKLKLNRIQCRIYADGQSQTVRECGFFDAYKHFLKLVKKMETGGNTVPIAVSLCPLKAIQDPAIENINFPDYQDIDDDLLDRCVKFLANLDAIKIKVKATMKANVSDNSWREFKIALQQFQQLFADKLKKGVVMARNGDEIELEKAVKIAENHPNFKPCQLEKWLSWKQAEISMAKEIAEKSDITIMGDKKELERNLVEFKKYALVLSLPALNEETNKMLEGMKSYVNNYNTLVAVENANGDEKTPWHMIHDEQMRVIGKIRDLVDHVKRKKRLMDNVRFFITLRDSNQQSGYFYSVYQADKLVKDGIDSLPCPPTDLQIHPEAAVNTYRVVWNYSNLGYPYRFVIKYRRRGDPEDSWKKTTAKSVERQIVVGCQDASVMEFRVAVETCVGISEYSDAVDTETKFDISVHEEDDVEQLEDNMSVVTQSTFVGRDIVEWDNYSSDPSEIVSLAAQQQGIRFAEALMKRYEKVGNRNGMDIYAVPLTKSDTVKSSDGVVTVERYAFGVPSAKRGGIQQNGRMQHRTVLMMGATGSGKTTLINGMINYVFNVQWDDNFRFQLVDEKASERSQSESQTSCIKVYDIHHVDGFRVRYSLTIVDTPGYGDTKGLKRDQEITQMIRQFFEVQGGIQELDVIGFVVPASLPRLTPTQMYIFDSVLAIFGKDVKENINFMLTFADGQDPPVLSAITDANLPCLKHPETGHPLHHKFNNSGFFCSNHGTGTVERFNKFFWEMGMKNFDKFFNVLATMNTKSLSLTKEVLGERKRLEATIDALQPLIQTGLTKMEEIRKTSQVIKNCRSQIEAHENVKFEVEVTVPRQVQIPDGVFVTNCNKCYVTCHFPCTIPNDDGKAKCRAMKFFLPESMRTCWNCPNRCLWTMHSNRAYKWEYITQMRATSSNAIREKYEAELNKQLTAEELIILLEEDVKTIDKNVLDRVETVSGCIIRLDEIALRPNPFSTPQYIDLIIGAEEQEKRPGFQERIESLEKLRKMAEIQSKIRNKESLMNPDPSVADSPDESVVQGEVTIELDNSSIATSFAEDDGGNSVVSLSTPRTKIGSFFSSVLNL